MKAATISKTKSKPRLSEAKVAIVGHHTHLCTTSNGSRCVKFDALGRPCNFVFDYTKSQGTVIYSPTREHVVVVAIKSKEA